VRMGLGQRLVKRKRDVLKVLVKRTQHP
jgi:hypothetical protein